MKFPQWLKKKAFGKSLDPVDLDHELRTHLELEAEERRSRGSNPEDAHFGALRDLGNMARIKENVYDMRPIASVEGWLLDARNAVRMMRKRPLMSMAIVVTLGICIAAVTTVYSAVDATILRALPYPEPERLGQIVIQSTFRGNADMDVGQNGNAWRQFKSTLTKLDVAVTSGGAGGVNFTSGDHAAYILQQRVSAGYFRVMGVPLSLGREFTEDEDRPGGPDLAIISNEMWRRSFDASPSIIGQSATLAGVAYEIVGVTPAGFEGQFGPADLWTPLRPSNRGEGQGINYEIIGRTRSGVTWAAADGEVAAVGESLFKQRRYLPEVHAHFGLVNLQKSVGRGLQRPLLLIMAATVLVLLIGCINIAGMLLARSAARSSEIVTRLALGAGRMLIVRQLLMENIFLGLLASVLGVVLGYVGIDWLRHQDIGWQILKTARLDWRTLSVTIAASFGASILFAIVPAFQAGRLEMRASQMGRGVGGTTHSRFRRLLPAFQVGIAVFLLIGAGLLVRSFRHLWTLDPGFDASNVVTATFSLSDVRYASPDQVARLLDNTLRRLKEIRGVESAAVAMTLPWERGVNTVFQLPSSSQPESMRLTNVVSVSPGFFETLRISLLQGRLFDDADRAGSSMVAVVNAAFASRYFPNSDPLHAQMRIGKSLIEIVAVVGDTQQKAGWGNYGPMGRVPTVYLPSAQGLFSTSSLNWMVRTRAVDPAIYKEIEETVRSVDPLLPIVSFRTLGEIKAQAFAWQQFLAITTGLAAALALALSMIGTYAMISNGVVERSREFGIRLALGATTSQAIRAAARPGLICAIVGLTVGATAARAESKLLQGLLWGVTTTDMAVFLIVPVAVFIVAIVGSVIPALKISSLDPALILRQE